MIFSRVPDYRHQEAGQAVDVAYWHEDDEYAVFPQGARSKGAIFAPLMASQTFIRPAHRYLFKRSDKRYPHQFWMEVIAYRVGAAMGLVVPPAFAAFNSKTGECGALIEWFYDDGEEVFVMGGDFMQSMILGFDRDKGTQHNLVDLIDFHQNLEQEPAPGAEWVFMPDWRSFWTNGFIFDAYIGNTDRHQDNWGIIFRLEDDGMKARMAPLFDNGTSLGNERLESHFHKYNDDWLRQYVSKGRHHIRYRREVNEAVPHLAMADVLRKVFPAQLIAAKACLDSPFQSTNESEQTG